VSASLGASSFWGTTPALVIVVLGSASLLTLALLALLRSRLGGHDLRGRVSQFAQMPQGETPDADDEVSRAEQEPRLVDRLLARRAWWADFKEKVEIARIDRSASEIVLLTAVASIGIGVVLSLLVGTFVILLPAIWIGPLCMLAIVNQRLAHQRAQFAEQFPSHLQEIASAMRAGHSLVGGLRSIASSAVEPMGAELKRVLADEQLGIPLDAALAPMAARMASEDVRQVALVAALHERTGGDMATVLDHIAEGMRERMELRRELQSLTAQARLSRLVVTLLPPGLLIVLSIEDSSYMRPMFHTSTGVVLLFLAAGLIGAGSLAMKAIVDVES
jgi:tight adherence protein B